MRRYLPIVLIGLMAAAIISLVWIISRSSETPKNNSDYYTDSQTGRQFFNDPNQNQESASYPNFMSLTGGENLFNNVTSPQYNQIRAKLEYYFQTTIDPDIRTAHVKADSLTSGPGTNVNFDVTAGTPEVTVHVSGQSVDYYNINLTITK